jgi:hypothetical protein
MQAIEALVERLRRADWKERDAVKTELTSVVRADPSGHAREALETLRRGELLEIQWEIEEVLDATAPPKPVAAPTPASPPPPAPEPPPAAEPDPNRALTMKDLVTVYDDPRGLVLHRSKVGNRWFATQVDPYTGQPQTFELRPAEISQLKAQLAGSPYWVLGAGGPGGA